MPASIGRTTPPSRDSPATSGTRTTASRNVFHTDLWHEHVRPVDRLLDDIDANALPAVTWVTPRFQLSDHPPFSTGHAHNWVTQIVNKVMRSDHVGAHGDLPHVGRVGRASTTRSSLRSVDHDRPRHPRSAAHDLSVHAPRRDRRRARRVLDAVAVHLRQLGAGPLTDRIRNTHNFEHVFDFSGRSRGRPKLGREKAPTYGTPWNWDFPSDTYTGWEPGTVPVEDAL